MKLFYRISSKSYEKAKLIGATKQACYWNFYETFENLIDDGQLTVIADNCDAETLDLVHGEGITVEETSLGNAGSLRFAIDKVLQKKSLDPKEPIYFCEDDYLHQPLAQKAIEEGLKRAEYVTLYDHPDKYTRMYNGGETSKVIKTASTHWRYTISTCMTFATTAASLKEDLDIWQEFTAENHPHDHQIFKALNKKGRRLAVSIPGLACHTDLEFSGRMKQMLIDGWAIEKMLSIYKGRVFCLMSDKENQGDTEFIETAKALLKDKEGWERLVAYDAILKHT